MATCKRFTFDAVGSGTFPADMLRYDHCWPSTTESASEIARDWRSVAREPGQRRVALSSHYPPTPARWASFSWKLFDVFGGPIVGVMKGQAL